MRNLDTFINDILTGKQNSDSPLVEKLKAKATEVRNLERIRRAKQDEVNQASEQLLRTRGAVEQLAELLHEELQREEKPPEADD